MLDAVDHCRLIRAFEDVHDAFQAQEIAAAMLGERFKKERQRHGPNGFVAHDRESIDIVAVCMFVVG